MISKARNLEDDRHPMVIENNHVGDLWENEGGYLLFLTVISEVDKDNHDSYFQYGILWISSIHPFGEVSDYRNYATINELKQRGYTKIACGF